MVYEGCVLLKPEPPSDALPRAEEPAPPNDILPIPEEIPPRDPPDPPLTPKYCSNTFFNAA
jgi:hypothetical protein